MTSNYKIESLLGTGGFSNVFLAEHRETGERVAIKILNNAEGDARFAREAAVLQALECPYTVRLLEFGRSVSGPFMVFELVEGAQELDTFLDAHGAMDWGSAVRLLRMMLTSLAEAHAMGVVHRDVKPANMLITPDGTIKVLDFGLVRLEPTLYDVTPLTQTGKVLGTPRYMAPEVLRAQEAAAPKADVFAVGMIAYHLLVGEPANTGRSAYEVIARHLDQDPYELPEHVDVPYAIRAWIDAMLRKDYQRRTPDAPTALAELERHLAETPLGELPVVSFDPPATPTLHEDTRPRRIGEFDLETELGRGATAAVWSVAHTRFGGRAAMKLMLAGVSEHARAAFLAEARAHASLSHPHVVRLLDFGHVDDGDVPPTDTRPGDPYLVMELADGTMREAGLPTTWQQAFDVMLQVLEALAYAHARGVIHRDLKPENVLVFGDVYKVSDFGIAHSLREQHRGNAETVGESIGTPRYMSPEQFRGHAHDFGPATDLYAFGCMAYELVCGRVPFASPRLVQIAQQHQSEPMPTPKPRFDVPEGLDGWLARLLAKRPEERFAAAADASWQLQQLAGGFVSGDVAEAAEYRAPSAPTVLDTQHRALAPGDVLTVMDEQHWDDPVVEEAATDTVKPGPNTPPPMPATWRQTTSPSELHREGLGLFSLRELPLAGQEDARDVLWDSLLRCQSEHELVPVVLDGAPGSPTSQLGSWFASRAVEVGAAHAVFVAHTLAGAPREGLAGAIEDLFGTWTLGDAEAAALVRRRMKSLDATDMGATDAEVIAQELLRARGANTAASSSELDRFSALMRLLRRRSRERPLILFLDHLQYSTESTAFVRYLLDTADDLRAVLVLGKRGTAPRPSLERDLEALAGDPRCRRLAVDAYTLEEYADFAALLLPLSAGLVAELAEATSRDPVLTRLTIADLIDRNLLEEREDSLHLATPLLEGELAPQAVIERRGARLMLEKNARHALSVCAILGEAPDIAEATAVCARLGIALPEGLGASLEDVGLAHSFGGGWWFTSGVTERLLATVPTTEQRVIRRACGHVVLERLAPDDAETWSRAARYFVEAGAATEALEPLYRAVRLLVSRDLETAEALAAQRGALLSQVGAGERSTEWIDQLNLLSVIAKTRGDRKQAIEHNELAHDLAVAEGYNRGLARALRDSAAVAVDLGSLGEAAARFDRAAKISAEAGDALDEAHAWFGAGFVEYRRANLGAAEQRYRAAIRRFEQVGATQAHARALSYLSAAHVAAGRFDEARTEATRAQELARSCGAVAIVAETKSDLAEIARFTGDEHLARRLYEENAHWQALSGSRSIGAITRLNLALVDLGAGEYQRALDAFSTLEADVRELGLASRLPLIRVAKLVATVGTGGTQADEALENSGELFAVADPDRDIAWAYECGVRACTDPGRKAWFKRHATAEYRRLGDEAAAARVAAL